MLAKSYDQRIIKNLSIGRSMIRYNETIRKFGTVNDFEKRHSNELSSEYSYLTDKFKSYDDYVNWAYDWDIVNMTPPHILDHLIENGYEMPFDINEESQETSSDNESNGGKKKKREKSDIKKVRRKEKREKMKVSKIEKI